MKNTIIFTAVCLVSLLFILTCNTKKETDNLKPQEGIAVREAKMTCNQTPLSTTDSITNLLGGFVTSGIVPSYIPGVVVSRNALVSALMQAGGKDTIGLFFLEEKSHEEFLWLVGRKSGDFYSTRLPKIGKPVKKCCPSTSCCNEIRILPSLCIDGVCQPSLTVTTDSITNVLGRKVKNLNVPPHFPGIALNKSTVLPFLSSISSQDKIGIFLVQSDSNKNSLMVVGKIPGHTAYYSIFFDPIPHTPEPSPVRNCCDYITACCDNTKTKINSLCVP